MIVHGDGVGGTLQVGPEWVPMGRAALAREGTLHLLQLSHWLSESQSQPCHCALGFLSPGEGQSRLCLGAGFLASSLWL